MAAGSHWRARLPGAVPDSLREPFAGLDPISLGVTGNLIRRLTDTLGVTSIVVTHDIQESLRMVITSISFRWRNCRAGTPDQLRASDHPFVHQFVHGEADGPIPFHYPAAPYADELELAA